MLHILAQVVSECYTMHHVDVLSQEVFKCELVVEKDGGTAFHELPWAPETVKSKQAPPPNLDPLQLYTHVHGGEHFQNFSRLSCRKC